MLEISEALGGIRPTLRVPSLSERVAGHIERLILEGRVRPGSRIVEEVLARELGISRASLREALINLENAGLIAREGRNTRVIRTLTSSDIVELYEMWTILEAEATAMACQTATAVEQTRIAEIMAAMEAAQDRASYHHLNLEFHRSLVAPCRNRRLVEAYDSCLKQVRWAWALAIAQAGDPESSRREHRAIAEAYFARDAERTQRLVRGHLSAGGERAARP
jgi:DNA-binding GntR family transcriptional regulator